MPTPPSPFLAETPRLMLRGIRKAYPGVVANDRVDLTVRAGEIHALVGENGAGKSTLMKVIAGLVRPDEGHLFWEGQPVAVRRPAQARKLGIGMVFQHFSLFESLTVAQNVALALPARFAGDDLATRMGGLAERYGLPVDPRRRVHSLSLGERQRVEILRCLLQNPRLLILDEPTSVLTPEAVGRLFEALRRLAAEGCSILYVSHKLEEIQELCHRATVLRAGRVTGTCTPAEQTPETMARLMFGADLPAFSPGERGPAGEVRLGIHGLSLAPADPFGTRLRELHLEVRAGEVVGIAGISGNGQQELFRAISGEEPLRDPACLQICGVPAGHLSPSGRRALGLGLVPEERLGRGAAPRLTLAENGLLTAHRQGMLWGGLIRFGVVRRFADHCIQRFQVRCGGVDSEARSLSGGNLQKFIVGREILQNPKLLVLAQPTWGMDVGAAAFIRNALLELRASGTAVLVISEELDELFQLCDRLVVMARGELSPSRAPSATAREEVGLWMGGLWPGSRTAGGGHHVA